MSHLLLPCLGVLAGRTGTPRRQTKKNKKNKKPASEAQPQFFRWTSVRTEGQTEKKTELVRLSCFFVSFLFFWCSVWDLSLTDPTPVNQTTKNNNKTAAEEQPHLFGGLLDGQGGRQAQAQTIKNQADCYYDNNENGYYYRNNNNSCYYTNHNGDYYESQPHLEDT